MVSTETIEQIRSTITNKETCGLLLNDLEIIQIQNTSNNPNTFIMNKLEFMKALNLAKAQNKTITAIWHTHPLTDSTPSEEDLKYHSKSAYGMLIVSQEDFYYAKARQPAV